MNLTIELREEWLNKTTNRVAKGCSVFKDVKSLKLETIPYDNNKYKVELILFLGDKYSKQLITIDNIERIVADAITGLIYTAAYKNYIISSDMSKYPEEPEGYTKPVFEYPESYIEPEFILGDIINRDKREILDRTICINNTSKDVIISVIYKCKVSDNGARLEEEKTIKYIDTGDFKCGKLKDNTDDNPGILS